MLYGCTFQYILLALFHATSRSYYPGEAGTSPVWAIPRSLATTGGITNLFSLPRGTKMFQFPRFASAFADDRPSACRVVPFGDPRIKGHLHLPAAFRSLSRPSSPPRAKASAMRPSLLSSVAWHRCHAPYFARCFSTRSNMSKILFLVENIGIEPMTSCLQGRRSSQLS